MPQLSPAGPAVPSSLAAGLLLCSISLLSSYELPHPTATAAIEATGVGRSRAYEVKAAIAAALPDLVRPPGRPTAPPTPSLDETVALTREVARYMMDHPGCVHGSPQRHRYSSGFHRFVLELWERHTELGLAPFAEATLIPPGTLKDWVRGGRDAVADLERVNLATVPGDKAKGPRIESTLAAYKPWKGSFGAFCDHVQLHLHIPWGRTTIGDVLDVYGLRKRKRRRGRRPDEKALRGQFETFFAGAQWSADGSPLSVTIDGQTYTFNLELNVDTHTGALVGISVRDTEDGAAVTEAFADSVATTGAAPIAQLLDNRPSNHTDEVIEVLGDTLKIRRTQGRPQNGAHVEGAFGLFQQMAPDIVLDTSSDHELARQALTLQVQTWARTLNHRPGDDQDGRSRARRYDEDSPTPEETEAARVALAERLRKQDKARLTRKARLDPVTRHMLDQAFDRLDLLDPDGVIRDAIAGYPLDAVLAGIAIFEAKRERGTLPDDVGGLYLKGIVRNIADEDEGIAFAEKLWQARRDAGDLVLSRLDDKREHHELEATEPMDLVRRFVDLAMATERAMDRAFWLRAVADTITEQPAGEHRTMFLIAARRIHATHRVPKKQRNAATRRLAVMVRPIA
ncbi:MAG: hypothetical protein QF464_03620 [Myxococcota bacterium]|jgi:hypothetical protein|nr:hypothetical protein [Myxococcota bacterium]